MCLACPTDRSGLQIPYAVGTNDNNSMSAINENNHQHSYIMRLLESQCLACQYNIMMRSAVLARSDGAKYIAVRKI